MLSGSPRTPEEAAARHFVDEADFLWHQRFELAPGVWTPGPSDIVELLEAAQVPDDLTGLSALDIGTANGGAAFALERRGAARVVAVDIYPPHWFGFDQTRELLGSNVEYRQTSIYALDLGEQFDVVLCWGVLYHLRHPLLGLDKLRAHIRTEASLETAVADWELASRADEPLVRFYRGAEFAGDPTNWFAPTVRALEDWCRSSGLEPTVLRRWPEDAPERCMLRLTRSEGDPEYVAVSYERDLLVRETSGPYVPGDEGSTVATGPEQPPAPSASSPETEEPTSGKVEAAQVAVASAEPEPPDREPEPEPADPEPAPVPPTPKRHLLVFTGTCDEATFNAAIDPDGYWYHTFAFHNGFEARGDYDIGLNIDEYGFPPDMAGLKVLDIGSASGWFSFFFEQRGAEVTAVDVPHWDETDRFGYWGRPAVEHPTLFGPDPDTVSLNPVSRTLWIMRALLRSRVRLVSAPVYEIRPELFGGQAFDLVFMGALLLHLRDPIGALMAARSVCRDRMIATNWLLPDPPQEFPRADLPVLGPEEHSSWWRPNRQCYELWFRAAGFDSVDVSRDVTLTGDMYRRKHYSAAPHNPTQVLGLADARVYE